MKEEIFCNKYNISPESYNELRKDGWVTCSAPQYETIYSYYKKSQSYQKTCDEFSISKSTLHTIIHRFE